MYRTSHSIRISEEFVEFNPPMRKISNKNLISTKVSLFFLHSKEDLIWDANTVLNYPVVSLRYLRNFRRVRWCCADLWNRKPDRSKAVHDHRGVQHAKAQKADAKRRAGPTATPRTRIVELWILQYLVAGDGDAVWTLGAPLVGRASGGRTCLRVRKAGAGERVRVRVRRWRCQVVARRHGRTPPLSPCTLHGAGWPLQCDVRMPRCGAGRLGLGLGLYRGSAAAVRETKGFKSSLAARCSHQQHVCLYFVLSF